MGLTLTQVEEEYNGHIVYNYYILDKDNNIVNNISCGDIVTTDENGNILTVNDKPYVHTKV